MMKHILTAALFLLGTSLPHMVAAFSSNPGRFSLASLREGFENKVDEALESYLARIEGDRLEALSNLEAQKQQEVEALQNELNAALQQVQQQKLNRMGAIQMLADLKLAVQDKELEMLRVKLASMKEQLESQLHIATSRSTELEQLRMREVRKTVEALEQELAIKLLERKQQLYEKQKLLNNSK